MKTTVEILKGTEPDPNNPWHGSTDIHSAFISKMEAHRDADQILQGFGWWQHGKGCWAGCLLEREDPRDEFPLLGLPQWLGYLGERIFEGLPKGEGPDFAVEVVRAVRPGANLEMVPAKFLLKLLIHEENGAVRHAKAFPDCEKAVRDVAGLLDRWIQGDKPAPEEFRALVDAADAARAAAYAAYAAYAARAAAYAAYAAAYAARAAAYAARAAAAYAADAARAAAYAADAADAADAAAYQWQASVLLRLLAEC